MLHLRYIWKENPPHGQSYASVHFKKHLGFALGTNKHNMVSILCFHSTLKGLKVTVHQVSI